jgi:hypothetical protein
VAHQEHQWVRKLASQKWLRETCKTSVSCIRYGHITRRRDKTMTSDLKGLHKKNEPVVQCIGCGCTDYQACINEISGEACFWLRVDRQKGDGVCSECLAHVAGWDESHSAKVSA